MIYILLVCFRQPFKGEWMEVDEKAFLVKADAEEAGRRIMGSNKNVVCKIRTYKEVCN